MNREEKALDFIRTYTQENGWPPSVREIGAHMGFKSSSTAQVLIADLVHKGLIERGQGPRQVKVTE